VGGVPAKIEAAIEAGAQTIIIPRDNWQETFRADGSPKIVPVERFEDVLKLSLVGGLDDKPSGFTSVVVPPQPMNAAAPPTT
jgi:Lon-like ATP-dependent protease